MKKVINRRLYDTDTATFVGDYTPSSYDRGDTSYYEESLYVKKTGEYFLYGKGGPGSKYAKLYGQSGYIAGEKITPISYDEAREWAENHMEVDDYLKHFEAEGDNSETSFTITIRAKEKVILDRLRSDGRTISQVISDLLKKEE